MNDIKISVLLPMYNASEYVLEAVNSILNQSLSCFELIIIDDNSDDNCVSIIEKIKDDRIILVKKVKNSGYTNSLNYGLKIAKGKYIARMDADDISHPERFKKQLQYLENNQDTILCGSWFELLDQDIIIKHPETNEAIGVCLLKHNAIGHPTVMFRKDVFINNNLFYDREMEPAEDYNLWVRAYRYGKLYNIPEVLLKYRVHNNQISVTQKNKQELNAQLAQQFHFTLLYGSKIPSFNINSEISFNKLNNSELHKIIQLYLFELKIIKEYNSINLVFDKIGFKDFCKNKYIYILNMYFLKDENRSLKKLLMFINPVNKYFSFYPNKVKVAIILKNSNFLKW